jgi:hypothetical protein
MLLSANHELCHHSDDVTQLKVVRKNDLDYYAAHTGNGPSMTWSMYVTGGPTIMLCDVIRVVAEFMVSRQQNYVTGGASMLFIENLLLLCLDQDVLTISELSHQLYYLLLI